MVLPEQVSPQYWMSFRSYLTDIIPYLIENISFSSNIWKSSRMSFLQYLCQRSIIPVSHEWMTVNEKFKSTYTNRFKCFLFMGTNKPVKITDAKSGLIRRLIDVSPSGQKLSPKEYKSIVSVNMEMWPSHLHNMSCTSPRRLSKLSHLLSWKQDKSPARNGIKFTLFWPALIQAGCIMSKSQKIIL